MPGNLLFADTNLPNVTGEDTAADLKNIMNYLYMLREELSYTMSNIGVENFNDTELTDLGALVTEDLSITVQSNTASIATISAKADANEAAIDLAAAYTGLDEVVSVTSWPADPDETKVYRYNGNYYRHDGASWVNDTSITSASLTLAAINGQSSASLVADRINFTGFTTFATTAGLADGTTTVDGGCLTNDTVETTTLKSKTESNIKSLDFYAGIDFTAMDEASTSYYPDSRDIKGVYKVRFSKDTSLSSGHGQTGNTLSEVGAVAYTGTNLSLPNGNSLYGGILLNNAGAGNTSLQLASTYEVDVAAGTASGASGNIILYSYGTDKTDGYGVMISALNGIVLFKRVDGTETTLDSWT